MASPKEWECPPLGVMGCQGGLSLSPALGKGRLGPSREREVGVPCACRANKPRPAPPQCGGDRGHPSRDGDRGGPSRDGDKDKGVAMG